jgi:hypothetical protein
LGSNCEVSSPKSLIVVSMPASARVDTAGLSSRITSGAFPSWAASSAWLVRAVVSYAVRSIVTPASWPHASTRFAQSELSSCCG